MVGLLRVPRRLHLNPPCDCTPDTSWNAHVEGKTSGMYARLTEREPFTSCGGFLSSSAASLLSPCPVAVDFFALFQPYDLHSPSSLTIETRRLITPFNASTLRSNAFLSQVRRIDESVLRSVDLIDPSRGRIYLADHRLSDNRKCMTIDH